MATISRENIGVLNDKVTVKLAKEDYLPAVELSIKNYAKNANIPGFRKGMVPTGMIKKMYGPSVFADEVLKTVEKELNGYMQKEQIDIFAQPLPLESDVKQLDINNPAEYTFAFEIGLKPAVDIDVTKLDLTRHKVEITDTMVEEEIERLKIRNGNMTEPEEVSGDENVLNLTFKEVDNQGNEIEGGINKDNSLLVKYFSESFRPSLIGKKKDDTIEIDLATAFGEKEREWIIGDLGLTAESANDKHFKALITKVGLIERPEMDEAFFTKAYPSKTITSEDEFRQAVREELRLQWEAQSRNQLHDQIYHALIDHTTLEFPEGFLKRWMQNGGEEQKTAEEADKEYPSFVNSLKWSLISTQLLNQNDITVEPAEIKDFAKQQIMGYMGGQNLDDAPWLDSYAESMLKDKKFIENTYYQLQTSKLFTILEERANIKEDTVTPEHLNSIQHHHEH